jgi:copper(I)-binding protein
MRTTSTLIFVAPILAISMSAAVANKNLSNTSLPIANVATFAVIGTGEPRFSSHLFVAATVDAPSITLDHVWARASPGNSTTAAAYLTVTNGGQPDHLVSVSTPVAATAELHETINDNGIMKMRPVAPIALDPGKPVSFQPGGYHVMLMGLKNPLKAGDSFPLTLTFEHAKPLTVTVHVETVGAAGMGHGAMHDTPAPVGDKP